MKMKWRYSGVPRISETYRLARLLIEATRESRASAADNASTTAQIIERIDSSKVTITPLEMNGHHSAMNNQSSAMVLIWIGPIAIRMPLNRNSKISSHRHHQTTNRSSNGIRDQRTATGWRSSTALFAIAPPGRTED